jgi:2-oxoglutarate ferredoxin oxidoreductase subunit beta
VLTAFKTQLAGLGLSMVEFLSSCPTNWHLSPPDALAWIRDTMVPYYPLGQVMQPTVFRANLTGVLEGFSTFWNVRRA